MELLLVLGSIVVAATATLSSLRAVGPAASRTDADVAPVATQR